MRATAGAVGAASQLRKIGNALEILAKAIKKSNIIVPPDEPENAMAPAKPKPVVTVSTQLTIHF